MNLEKLFSMQKVLRDRIGYNEPDRFNKLILALLVELGECANEWRGFKFWSVNQLPHTSAVRVPCMMEEDKEYYNPLLEEYVDGLHFVLEIGLEHGIDKEISGLAIDDIKYATIEGQFTALFKTDWEYCEIGNAGYYHEGLELYISLGEMLGFTWDEVEKAYFTKNEINHARQDSGVY
ncbi:dimeric dUTPase (all-alpha-NTP-PPase superfamily) [Neobacillus sp. B4I6]|uniref:dUTP diphosphatase n=1 Tax=Neobacillus sp. B4I6 TaxID=3373925 RepID=UPI003D2227C6